MSVEYTRIAPYPRIIARKEKEKMAELRECPFCGSEATIDDCGDRRYFVKCTKCSINQDHLYATKRDAVKAWNRRKGEHPQIVRHNITEVFNFLDPVREITVYDTKVFKVTDKSWGIKRVFKDTWTSQDDIKWMIVVLGREEDTEKAEDKDDV